MQNQLINFSLFTYQAD